MKYGKSIATLMAALMSLVAVAYPVLSQTTLGQYPSFLLNSNGSLNALIVVGASASPEDVIAAADIAVRLGQAASTSVTVPSSTSSTAINGLMKNTIDINFGNITDVFPNPIRSFHYSGLKTGTITYMGNTYNYHEDINLNASGSPIYFSHDFATNYINGTETMVVGAGTVAYEYVFDSALNCTALSETAQNTCTLSNFEYTNPVEITMAGKPFVIVGIGNNQVVMLSGNVGTATATSGVTSPSGNYTVYSDLGSNGAWARVIVKDASGNTVETQVINQGSSYDFTNEGFTVKVTTVQALQDGTVVGTGLVVGPIGQTTITYTTSCSIGGTGSSNTNFPGETNYCIQVGTNKQTDLASFASSGAIAPGDTIQVVYKPSSTQYFKYQGSTVQLPLPNNYAQIGFEGWNYNTFATLTFKYLSPTTVYYSIGGGSTNSTPVTGTTVSGIEIDSDTPGTLVDPNTNTGYSRVYYLFNTTSSNSTGGTTYPVMWGFWDSSNNRIGVDLASPYYAALNAWQSFSFNTTLSYGGGAAAKDQQHLDVVISGPASATTQAGNSPSGATSYFNEFAIVPDSASPYVTADCGSTGGGSYTSACGLLINWVNTSTTWNSGTSPTFRLYTSDSPNTHNLESFQTPAGGGAAPTLQDIGQAVQNVVDNGGTIAVSPDTQGTNVATVMLPAQALQVQAYVGMAGATTAATGGTYQQIVPVTQSISYLDSEITSTQEANNDLILVGGPCVNTIVAQLATASGNSSALYPYTCASWPAQDFGSIRIIDNAFGTGHPAIVVAGTTAAYTRMAADVLQQYDTLLVGQTSPNVQVTSLSTTGVTAVS